MNSSDPISKSTAEAFSRLISRWMEREKVSYAEAVDRLGLSPVVLGQYLAGNRLPTEEQRAAMVEKMK